MALKTVGYYDVQYVDCPECETALCCEGEVKFIKHDENTGYDKVSCLKCKKEFLINYNEME